MFSDPATKALPPPRPHELSGHIFYRFFCDADPFHFDTAPDPRIQIRPEKNLNLFVTCNRFAQLPT